eukprot:CAMPEP_0183298032 /NCGR_PEP_ID=MMETSP0160_2-20130417/5167_1 /TAXON_ID=2839 ORGANISM="Odontella Sinensis, Strain Grunow 1884" /NCGR_SAMPLE_ID=MMETSP0160_2 /ASSEMBLY_ACC=CAM_ASM_000250 /LENGTH=303 /DNA_ID=CAMNT_0025459973 /DNA_START=126 /DNA_END=1037 /DNA_ORIENTATION=-
MKSIAALSLSLPSASAFTVGGIAHAARIRSNMSLRSSLDEQRHAREVFDLVDTDKSESICLSEFGEMLRRLDVDASEEETATLFDYLDADGGGDITFDEFAAWYADATGTAKSDADAVRDAIRSRRAVREFDATPVSDEVVRRAIECAIAAPNRSRSEPWRFVRIGRETGERIEGIEEEVLHEDGDGNTAGGAVCSSWSDIPGCCVITSKLSPDNPVAEENDFVSTVCAVQNFMLSLWSEGIGSRLVRSPLVQTREFADLCGIDTEKEKVVGCVWYGFVSGGLLNTSPWVRSKSVDDVLSDVP